MPKTKLFDTAQKKEKAVIIAVYPSSLNKNQVEDYIEEQKLLVQNVNIEVIDTFIQRLDKPHNATYLGSGKLNDVSQFIKDHKIEVALFDDELSPSQIKNLSKILNCKVIDKSMLILDLFALRARTVQAKTQVELAQLQYLLPRLTRLWTHLERQKGGIGFRGPGETQIESDKRIIRQRISLLRKKLDNIEKQNANQRKSRNLIPRFALVGYTNAGKSSLLNALSKTNVYVEDQLFATLDTTVRKINLNGYPFLLSDTVGFIRKLPHLLIQSFNSTLNEVKEADLLIHVVDVSNKLYNEFIEVVVKTLSEIKASTIPSIIVFNKIDVLDEIKDNKEHWINYKKSLVQQYENPVFFTSIRDKNSVNVLREFLVNFATNHKTYV